MSENGLLKFTRKDLLNDLKTLKSFYDIFGKEKLISWILNEDSDGNITPCAHKNHISCDQSL